MKRIALSLVLVLALVLAACSPASPAAQAGPVIELTATIPALPTAPPTQSASIQLPQPTTAPVTQQAGRLLPELTDDQGMVVIAVQPLNVGSGEEWLEFNVSMNTHSVDLSMDLAALATLTTDNGLTVQAILWDAPRGGHHIKGTLVFPASLEGKSLFEGATTMIIIIKDVDAPVRIFTWDLPQ